MLVLRWFFFGIISLLLLSGCSPKTPEKSIKKKITVVKYKDCEKHIKIMRHASEYIDKEFKEGYLLGKDIVGAEAQLFLIQSKSPTIFAKNINAAEDSYTLQYQQAKSHECDVDSFKQTPLEKVTKLIQSLGDKK